MALKRKFHCSMVGCEQNTFIGATESCAFVRKLDFAPNQAAFDAAFSKK